MKRLMMIAKSNMKKRKTNIILIFILTAIATMFLYTGLNVTTDVNSFLDKLNDKQNGADVMFVSTPSYGDDILNVIKTEDGFDYYEKEDTLEMFSCKLKDLTTKSKEGNYNYLFFDINNKRTISDLEIKNKGKELKDNSIVLPAYFNISCGYNVGDIVELCKGEQKFIFEIYGFVEDVMFSNPSSYTMLKGFINTPMFNKIQEEDLSALKQSSFTIKLKDGYESKKFEESVKTRFTKEIEDVYFSFDVGINFQSMKVGTSIFVYIMMAVISVFAVIIIIVSLIVIRFSINTTIESDLKNIGILQAVGYRSQELKRAAVIEYMLVSVAGTIFGLGLSIIAKEFIAKAVSSTIGLYWQPGINIVLILFSILVINLIIFAVVELSTRKFKKINTLTALRNGKENHNFKKNYLSLERCVLGLNNSLGIKEILQNKKQNISMIIIVMLLSFTSIIGLEVYYNFAVNPTALMTITGLEKTDILVAPCSLDDDSIEKMSNVYAEIKEMDEVEDALFYTMLPGNLINGENNISLNLEIISDIDNLKVKTLTEGRDVKHDNEIMVTNVVLKNLQAELGDTIYVECSGNKVDFVIVGVTQQIPNMGICAKINEEGMKRISSEFKGTTIYTYLNEGTDVDKVVDKLSSIYSKNNISVMNFANTYNSIMSSFNKGIGVVALGGLVVTALIIALILFMLIKIKLLKESKIYGVYKALGYKSKEIMWQITMNFAPIISIGVLLGIILGIYLANPVMIAAFSFSGVEKCSIVINPLICIVTFIFMSLLAIIISFISSKKVRKIEPCKIIME